MAFNDAVTQRRHHRSHCQHTKSCGLEGRNGQAASLRASLLPPMMFTPCADRRCAGRAALGAPFGFPPRDVARAPVSNPPAALVAKSSRFFARPVCEMCLAAISRAFLPRLFCVVLCAMRRDKSALQNGATRSLPPRAGCRRSLGKTHVFHAARQCCPQTETAGARGCDAWAQSRARPARQAACFRRD